MSETIPIASDHAGYALKQKLARALAELGYEVEDLGTHSAQSTDYADYAHPLARQVSEGRVKRGVLMCGTGLGMSYTANRYPHVRAAVAWSPEIAKTDKIPTYLAADRLAEQRIQAVGSMVRTWPQWPNK